MSQNLDLNRQNLHSSSFFPILKHGFEALLVKKLILSLLNNLFYSLFMKIAFFTFCFLYFGS
jgi:hypothetical protein